MTSKDQSGRSSRTLLGCDAFMSSTSVEFRLVDDHFVGR